jgi:hypothetical protein
MFDQYNNYKTNCQQPCHNIHSKNVLLSQYQSQYSIIQNLNQNQPIQNNLEKPIPMPKIHPMTLQFKTLKPKSQHYTKDT